ncbi:MAG: hypothetical protein R3D30_03410 [Hyphomicrobiales bacterium]
MVAIPGDPYILFDINAGWSPLLLVRKDAFDMLGGFTTDYKVAGDVEEFIMSAVTAGLTVEIVPEVLTTHDASIRRAERLNLTGGLFRSIRPHLSAVPTELQALLLASRSLSLRFSGTPEGRGRTVSDMWLLRKLPFFLSLGRRLPEPVRRHIAQALLRSRTVHPPISPAGDA